MVCVFNSSVDYEMQVKRDPQVPQPNVRVCVPVAKPLRLVREAIESLLIQSYSNWEATVLDDRGDHELEEYVHLRNDKRLTYVGPGKDRGIAHNWNRGIDRADHEYFFILHDDDVLLPNFLHDAVETLNSNPRYAAVHCRSNPIIESRSAITKFAHWAKETRWTLSKRRGRPIVSSGQSGLADLFNGQWMLTPTFVYRASVIRQFRFASLHFALDLDLLGRLLLSGFSIAGLPTANYRMRVHSGSQTYRMSSDMSRFAEEHLVLQRLASQAKLRRWYLAWLCGLIRPLLRIHILLRLLFTFPVQDKAARKTLIRLLFSK